MGKTQWIQAVIHCRAACTGAQLKRTRVKYKTINVKGKCFNVDRRKFKISNQRHFMTRKLYYAYLHVRPGLGKNSNHVYSYVARIAVGPIVTFSVTYIRNVPFVKYS